MRYFIILLQLATIACLYVIAMGQDRQAKLTQQVIEQGAPATIQAR